MKALLISINAKNIHKSPACWCLKAYADLFTDNCDTTIAEFSINELVSDLIDAIYTENPDIIGFSCYIWNIELIKKIIASLRLLLSDSVIILGGPEVSFEKDFSEFPQADYIICGAGEEAFTSVIKSIKNNSLINKQIIKAENKMKFSQYPSPFTESYFASFSKDMPPENCLIYYESSRGCPFKCSYCLSSADEKVEFLPLERVFEEINLLLSHNVKCIKFVDRTFNADKKRAYAILEFISTQETDCTFHFEAAADLFDDALLNLIRKLPHSRVQFEIGIQSINPKTLDAVCRQCDIEKAFKNLTDLVNMRNCHIHADLIAGLPEENSESFVKAINALINIRVNMLQMGFLKVLKGAALRNNKSLVYNEFPPYQILKTDHLSAEEIIHFRKIEMLIDKFYNSSMYTSSVNFALAELFDTPYQLFSSLAEFIGNENPKISLKKSYELIYRFLKCHSTPEKAAHYVKLDCFTHDPKCMLPDEIPQYRRKNAERGYLHNNEYTSKNVRAEYFTLTDETLLFIYEKKDPIFKSYKVLRIEENADE